MSARGAGQRGFTLVELLAAMLCGLIVIFAVFGLLDTTVRVGARTVDRLDATDRGRRGIDLISQQIASRICLSTTQQSLVAASDNSLEFYGSLAPEDTSRRIVVQRRRLTYRPQSKDVLQEVWTGTAQPPTPPPGPPTEPTRSTVVMAGVIPIASTPIFQYWALAGTPALPTLRLGPGTIAVADLPRAVQIEVSFIAQAKRADANAEFRNQILNRSPTCFFKD